MRRRVLSFDAWLCLALSALIAMGTGKVAQMVAKPIYDKQVEAHQAVDGEIGGKAGEEVFRVQNVEYVEGRIVSCIEIVGVEHTRCVEGI